jgi:hypothetical protein
MLAIVLSGLILVVLFAGLDDLPRHVRAQIAGEQQNLANATSQLHKVRDEVTADLRAEPDLFRVHSMSTALPARLTAAEARLQTAQRQMNELAGLAKANRRRDGDRAERLLREEAGLRSSATTESAAVEKEAAHWIDLKNHLPEQAAQMERDYEAVRGTDLGPVTASVLKAEVDWPDKKNDLETRLGALLSEKAGAEKDWQTSAALRQRVVANQLAGLDYVALIGAADSLHQASMDVPAKAKELQGLSGQLYDSWDKILVDLEIRRSGERRYYDEKIKTVRTHLVDVAGKKAETSSDDQWVDVSEAQYKAVENNLGMAIEHKSAGKYDFEAERLAQPAGFAYVAPPAQGSNQYGYWVHQNGQSFWTWFPQYLILRDLLYAHDYRPLSTVEWQEYRTYRSSGQTYYGRAEGSSEPRYGSQGTFTQRRYSDSNYARSGGYRDSRFATGSGGYKGSRFESRGAQSGQDSQPRAFGRQGSSDESRSWSRHSGGPGQRVSPRSAPPRSSPRPGRSFGGRRR